MQDYAINVFDIAWLDRNIIDLFQSDFWIVADFFWQLRNTQTYQPTTRPIRHPEALLQMLSALRQDGRFEEINNELQGKGGFSNMCEVLDAAEARGEARGISIGEKQGEIKGFIRLYSEEMHLKAGDIVRKIIQRFSLDPGTAEQYVEETLGLRTV